MCPYLVTVLRYILELLTNTILLLRLLLTRTSGRAATLSQKLHLFFHAAFYQTGRNVGGKWGASSRLLHPAMSLRLMRIRCVAAKRVLHEAATPARRKELSREQANSVCDTLLAPSSSLTASDVEVVSELVTDVGFETTDLILVLDDVGALTKSLKWRRLAQKMHPQIIH